MAIGEIVLGSFFQVLFDKLSSLASNYAQQEGTDTTILDDWKRMLVTINAVVDDAEEKQLSGNCLVKLWLDDVRDLAFDIEDLLDEFDIKATQVKSEVESKTSRGQWKRKFFPFTQPGSLVSDTKVQDINGRLEAIVKRKAGLGLGENVVYKPNNINKRDPTSSLPESWFFGREKEEMDILELLIREDKNYDATLSIVPIVGMGGVGKTALAQRLYNNAKVNSCFEKKAWVCVSDVFDVLDITKTILRSITELSNEGEDFDKLQVKLKNSLSGKKFLVVLDDIWNEKYEKWTALLKPFEVGAKGSKIIITTRNLIVASITGASPYHLRELSFDNCQRLLAFHALGATNFESHLAFKIIGKKIVERCQGLPLAAKMLGGVLRTKSNPDEWEDTLNNKIWDLPMAENDEVLPVLKLSYVHLPSYLKRCFAYCAVFPKDYEIEKDELALLWITEGLLDGQKANENILKLGRKHFDELVSRSFLQQSSINTSKFSMHDLLNDLAKSIARRTCFSSGGSQVARYEHDVPSLEKTRYASFIPSWYVTSKCLRPYQGMKALRSLILVRDGSSRTSFSISNKVLHDLLTNLEYLRVFSLCHCDNVEVPNCVGDLKHLRYLNFSYTHIKRLPESISALCKLQALILRGCYELSKLPQGITELVSLQFLDIRDTVSLKEMPLGIGNLKNLIILSKFVVGQEKGSQLKELKNLPHLEGQLFISELQKVEKVIDAADANLLQKLDLANLSLHWDKHVQNLHNHELEAQVLDFLQPHTNLKNLTILNYGGARFPSWLDCTYSKIVSLCLWDCPNVVSLPMIGQLPSLKELSLTGLYAIGRLGSEFYGGKMPFSSLTTLKFEKMSTWRDWSPYVEGPEEEVSFSRLLHLVVQGCPLLVGTLPYRLDHLIKLEIHSCPHLNNSTNDVCLPSLRELYLEVCDKEILKCLVNLTSLTILTIKNLAELVCFDYGFMSHLIKLKELHIRGCDQLKYLWQDGNEMLNLTCLQELTIVSCPQFTSFVSREREIELPCNLEKMELSNCTSLEKLPSKMYTLNYLSIIECPKLIRPTISSNDPNSNDPMSQLQSSCTIKCDCLTSFPLAKGRLATLKEFSIQECKGVESLEEITVESLECMRIGNCENLRSLPQCLHTLSHLTRLYISNCPALEIEDFPALPLTLSVLRLKRCSKIKSIAGFSNLTSLGIRECPALEMENFPPLPLTLSSLSLVDCSKIKSLPNRWRHLTSLSYLLIARCQNIKCLPEGGLPPNLETLVIYGCENLEPEPVREWGFHRLTSLTSLDIDGRIMGGEGERARFPSGDEDEEDAWRLLYPSSLTRLHIRNMRNVERLSRGLRNHLSSLQQLWIRDCPKLRELPEDGLPPSLRELWIWDCENLKDRFSKHTGDYWPLIQDIPRIYIDGSLIQ